MPVTRAEHNFKIKVCAVEKRAREKNRIICWKSWDFFSFFVEKLIRSVEMQSLFSEMGQILNCRKFSYHHNIQWRAMSLLHLLMHDSHHRRSPSLQANLLHLFIFCSILFIFTFAERKLCISMLVTKTFEEFFIFIWKVLFHQHNGVTALFKLITSKEFSS